jgi:hypothetical protein
MCWFACSRKSIVSIDRTHLISIVGVITITMAMAMAMAMAIAWCPVDGA